MGNSKSQPKETPVSIPRGDILVPLKTSFNTYPRLQSYKVEPPRYTLSSLAPIIEPPRVPVIPNCTRSSITPSYNTSAYEIWRNEYLDKHVKRDQIHVYQTNIDKHAEDEFDRNLRRIRLERERVISEMHSEKVSPKPIPSLNSLCNFAKRYTSLTRLDKLYFSSKPDRPELTDDMLKLIDEASRTSPPQEVISQIDGVDISRKDIRTLTGFNWLNDEVINAYMSLIVSRGKKSNYKSVYAFNTFFYPKIRESGYASVKRWTRKVDVFSFDFLLVPIHLGNHWCLAFIDFTSRTISYYDSLGGRPNGCCDTLLDYLRNESNDKKKQDFDDENWRLIDCYSETGIPKQCNGSDCGVFACTFAEYLTRKAKLNFSQDHMSYFRRKMIYELVTRELLQ